MISNFCCKSLFTCDSHLFRSNLILSVIFSFVSVMTLKETISHARLSIFFCFSDSAEQCADRASSFPTSATSCRSSVLSCQFFDLFDEFRVPLES